ETLRERVRQRVNQEEEFVVDPLFFRALKARLPKVCRVEILPKWGTAENELTRFRYDAILHIGEETPVPVPKAWQRWDADIGSLEELAAALKACADDTLDLRGLPLARLNT